MRDLVDAGRIEILGGPYYEPILAGIPRRDRVGQMMRYSDHLKSMFGQPVRGMWLPERVWEQQFAGDIAEAGLEYCVLDDGHLRAAGLRDEDLTGHFLTEDDGKLIALFPGDEHLRYLMPFRPPHETIDYLRHVADARETAGAPRGTAVVFGDDGEKFGTWPGTQKPVYENGWLKQFFEAAFRKRRLAADQHLQRDAGRRRPRRRGQRAGLLVSRDDRVGAQYVSADRVARPGRGEDAGGGLAVAEAVHSRRELAELPQ